jgi:hypothetical protein
MLLTMVDRYLLNKFISALPFSGFYRGGWVFDTLYIAIVPVICLKALRISIALVVAAVLKATASVLKATTFVLKATASVLEATASVLKVTAFVLKATAFVLKATAAMMAVTTSTMKIHQSKSELSTKMILMNARTRLLSL